VKFLYLVYILFFPVLLFADTQNVTDSVSEKLTLAKSYYQENLPMFSAEILLNIKKNNPNDTDVIFMEQVITTLNDLGKFVLKENDGQEAISVFQLSLQLNPNQSDVLLMLGKAYENQNQEVDAIKAYEASLAISPNERVQLQLSQIARRYFQRGYEAYNKGKDFNQAISHFTKCINLDPKFVEGYYWLGLSFKSNKNNDHARLYLKKTLVLFPSHTGAKNALINLN